MLEEKDPESASFLSRVRNTIYIYKGPLLIAATVGIALGFAFLYNGKNLIYRFFVQIVLSDFVSDSKKI